VARGDLARGARLPSVRNLAVDLGLNVNTVARAYRDLERAGVVDTMPGMGTFVAHEAPMRRAGTSFAAQGGRSFSAPRPIPATGGPMSGLSALAPVSTSWRDLLAAAHALAVAEGTEDATFLDAASQVVAAAGQGALLLVSGASTGECADLLRALPADAAGVATAVQLDDLAQRAESGSAAAVLTTFPSQARVRARLGDAAARLPVVPVETELTETAVRQLSTIPPAARIGLVTVEKDRWDEEANDVMKIIGRHRWLKMVLIDGAARGLAERIETLDAVVFVPRARDAVEALDRPGRVLVELARQVTPRTRERLRDVLG
jgi:hypothetical protein